MARSVSATFRQNCYDSTKKQRMTFLSTDGSVLFSNEDIAAGNKIKFNLSCINSQQVTFGETPCNTIDVTLINDDGRITSSDIGKEYQCYIGVEVSDANYVVSQNAISAVSNGIEHISVHSEEPYIRGNIKLGTTISQLSNGYPCKILFAYDALYFVVKNGSITYYGKHSRTGDFTFGNNQTPNAREKANLDKLMASNLTGIVYYKDGFDEYREGTSTTDETTNWSVVKSGTWNNVKSHTWNFYSGTTSFIHIHYEVVPYGVWHFDKPRRIKESVLTLSGKDRMDRFDEDSKNFAALGIKIIRISELITSIAKYKNVPIGDLSALNALSSEININASFYYQYKSLKDLLSYAFEVCGSNAIIDAEGRLSAMSANQTAIALPYVYSFDVADYEAHTISKMLIYHQGDYFLYQEDNTVTTECIYDWTDNPFFNNSNPTGSWFSKNIHKKYGGFKNAITTSDADYSLWCDDSYSWTEGGVTYREPIFSMTVEWNGFGQVTYTNYGTESRELSSYDKRVESVSSINDNNLQGFNKAKYNDKLEFDSNGLTIYSQGMKILNHDGDEVLTADSNGNLTVKGKIEADSGRIGNWDIVDDNLKCVSDTDSNNYILMGKNRGYPTMMLCEPIGISSAGETIYKGDVRASGMYFSEVTGTTSVSAAFLSYGRSSRGRTLSIQGNNFSDDLGACDIRMISQAADMLIAPVITFSTSPYISTASTTTSNANTALVSGSYGRQICLVSSLRKYKDNIKTIENASEKVDNLRGVSFTSKCEADDPKQVFYGFIAEEVEKAVPELASYEDGKLQSVQYDRVCALLVEDNKACHKRIAELEERLERLEKKLNGK